MTHYVKLSDDPRVLETIRAMYEALYGPTECIQPEVSPPIALLVAMIIHLWPRSGGHGYGLRLDEEDMGRLANGIHARALTALASEIAEKLSPNDGKGG